MVDLALPSPQLVTAQDPQNRVSGSDVARSSSYIAQGLDTLGQGLGQLAVPLAEQAGQQAVTRNPDGSLNVTTPASSFILGRAGDAYADAVITGQGAALRSKIDADFTDLHQQHQGDAMGFQRAAGSYIDCLAAQFPGPIGSMVQQYGGNIAVQTRDGIINQKARTDLQSSLSGQQGRIQYLENAMNGLAADGGTDTPQYAQMKAERASLQDGMVGNPLSGYSAQQRDNDDTVFTQTLGTAAAVGHGRRIYEQTHNLAAATQATQDDLSGVTGLSEGQKIRALGEISMHLRGLDATRQQANQDIKDQADALVTQSKATGKIAQTQLESMAQQLEGRRLYAKAAEVRAQGLFQSYQPAIIGGSGQEATDALRKVIGAAAGGATPGG